MGILYDPQNVVVGQAVGYFAVANTPMPANSIEAFGDWGVLWKQAGGTEEGWRLGGDSSTTPHNIEEQPNPVAVTLESRGINVTAALAEDTLESLRLAFGGGTITTTAAAGGVGIVEEFTLSDNVDEFAVGLDMLTVGGKTRRIYIPRAAGSGNVDVAFRRSAAKRTWPVAFAALCKPSDIIIRDIAPAPVP